MSAGHGRFVITGEGASVLQAGPQKITMQFLAKYPSWVAFKTGGNASSGRRRELSRSRDPPPRRHIDPDADGAAAAAVLAAEAEWAAEVLSALDD